MAVAVATRATRDARNVLGIHGPSQTELPAILAVGLLVWGCGGPAGGETTGGHDGGATRNEASVGLSSDAATGCDSSVSGVQCLAATLGPTYTNGSLAVDDASVFVAASGQTEALSRVVRIPRAGGSEVVVTAGAPASMLSDGMNLYWGDQSTTPSSIKRVPISGGAAVSLAPTVSFQCLAQDETYLYWTDQGPPGDSGRPGAQGVVGRVPKAGGTVTTFPAAYAWGIVVDDTSIYWFGDGLFKVSKTGAGSQPLPTTGVDQGCRSLAIAGSSIYIIDQEGDLVALPTDGSAMPTLLVPATNNLQGVVADSSHVFWMGSTTTAQILGEIAVDGGAMTMRTPPFAGVNDFTVASDGTVYFSTLFQLDSLSP